MKKIVFVFALSLTLSSALIIKNTFAYQMKSVEEHSHDHSQHDHSSHDHSHGEASESNYFLAGKIVETMNSGGYTYLYIDDYGKKTWVAIPETTVSVGQEIVLQPGFEMTNFESKTLNRTFDKIIFSNGPATPGQDAPAYNMKGSKGVSVSPDEKIHVEKAEGSGAYTIEELYENSKKLNKEKILVKGKVVKVSVGIMGKNWLHLQDGSGSKDKNNFDLVVTTKDQPSVGDIVTVNGVLYKDKDFGSGYKYDVIVEEATVKK
ncbi:MAG: DNA-binding protein [Candidatus Kuenenia sp.]|nr:DNA-binding protein [Candidatus Kuenenia hertensis]